MSSDSGNSASGVGNVTITIAGSSKLTPVQRFLGALKDCRTGMRQETGFDLQSFAKSALTLEDALSEMEPLTRFSYRPDVTDLGRDAYRKASEAEGRKTPGNLTVEQTKAMDSWFQGHIEIARCVREMTEVDGATSKAWVSYSNKTSPSSIDYSEDPDEVATAKELYTELCEQHKKVQADTTQRTEQALNNIHKAKNTLFESQTILSPW